MKEITKSQSEILILCENIKKLREKENLSKTKMAKLLGIGVKSLESIEKGVLPNRVSCNILFKIYDRFGIVPIKMFLNN